MRHEKTDLKVFVVVIPKEGLGAPPILLWVWQRQRVCFLVTRVNSVFIIRFTTESEVLFAVVWIPHWLNTGHTDRQTECFLTNWITNEGFPAASSENSIIFPLGFSLTLPNFTAHILFNEASWRWCEPTCLCLEPLFDVDQCDLWPWPLGIPVQILPKIWIFF